MAAPTSAQIERLGPLVKPFERRSGELQEGEAIVFNAYTTDITDGGLPPDCVKVQKDVARRQGKEGRYLWIIDTSGLRVMKEDIANPFALKGCMCHTNITGGAPALQGGELWFGDDGALYINNKSGRYGASTSEQEEAVLEYFMSIGHNDIVHFSFHSSGTTK